MISVYKFGIPPLAFKVGKELVSLFKDILPFGITIVLMEIPSSDRNWGLEKCLKLLELIIKLSQKTNIIISSEVSQEEINERMSEINKDQLYYFDKLKIKIDPDRTKSNELINFVNQNKDE